MINQPTILIRSQLEWEHGNGETYRLVAKPTNYGYNGVDYVVEELTGVDSMGIEQWKQPEFGCHSMVIAALAQQIIKDKNL